MAGETQTPAPQEGAGESPQEGGAGAAPTPLEGGDDPQQSLDPVIAARERDEAKREAQTLRRKLRELEKAEADRQAAAEQERMAALSDVDKVKAEIEQLRKEREEWVQERRRLVADAEARDLGTKLGLLDYRDALALIPDDEIEVDDDGRPTNLEPLFRELVKQKPYLAGKAQEGRPAAPNSNASSGTSGGPSPKLTSAELEAANKAGIDPQRYAALKGVKTLAEWQSTRQSRS